MKDIICLTIPAKPEYMVCLRLTASSVAEQAGFDIETIEDIKTAVAEASLQLLQITEDQTLSIKFEVGEALMIEISTVSSKLPVNSPEAEISAFLLEALTDSTEFTQENGISKYLLIIKNR